jgi:hypothetical protein
MALKAVSAPLGSPVGGSGTPGTIPVWSGTGTTLGDSPLTVSGSNVTGAGAIRATGTSAGAPAFTGSDTDTGIYFPAANQVRFSTGGSLAIAIDASQNVGIGTASPLSIAGVGLTVYGATNGAFYLQNSSNNSRVVSNGNDVYIDAGAGGTGGAVVFRRSSSVTESARIDSAGNFGVATSTMVAPGLTITDPTNTNNIARLNLRNTNSDGGNRIATVGYSGNAIQLFTASETTGTANNLLALFQYNNAIFYTGTTATNPQERARIDSAGNFILNSATTNAVIQASGTGQGLKLPATPGNADTQTLDCYQENYASNSWTPVIFGGTTAGTATYSVQEGFYTRWGNLIFCTATVVFSGHTGTGNLSLSGLPFAAKTAGSGTYRSSIIIEEGGGVKAILRLQSGTTATTTGVSIAASGNYVITFVYATN